MGQLAVSAHILHAAQTAALPPCPSSPNCVSSQSSDRHRIAPFVITGTARSAFDRLRTQLGSRSDTRLMSADAGMLRVEFRTRLGFVDDGLFVLDAAGMQIHVRSAARLGYWDFGKNRSRMEEIRRDFMALTGSR